MSSSNYDCLKFPMEGMVFDEDYVRNYAICSGGNSEGAQRHFELLRDHCPEGYQYYGKVSKEYAQKTYSDKSQFIVMGGITLYDIDGHLRPDDEVVIWIKR